MLKKWLKRKKKKVISKIKEIYKWRELLFILAMKDLKIKYRQATGGFGWMLVMPMVQAVIFTFIFRFLFKIKIQNYPLFLLSGLFSWSFLRSSLDGAANSILSNSNLIKKSYFPMEVLPLSNIITNLINYLLSLAILFILSGLFYKVPLFPALLWLPLIIFIQLILIIGICLFLAGLNTVYRDVQFAMEIILLIWFYATPVVYSLEMVKNALPATLFTLYEINPIVGIILGYQNIFVQGTAPDIGLLFLSAIAAVIFFILGFISFRHYEDIFVDII